MKGLLSASGVDRMRIGPFNLSASHVVPSRLEESLPATVSERLHVVHPSREQFQRLFTEEFRVTGQGGEMFSILPAGRAALEELGSVASEFCERQLSRTLLSCYRRAGAGGVTVVQGARRDG
jgi:hypothetical protein